MMLQLLLVLAAFRVTQADFKPCPEDSACLYHAHCTNPSLDEDFVLETTNPGTFDAWQVANCSSGDSSRTNLFVRPLSNHKWNLTLACSHKNVGISFGDSLTIFANETEATFKTDSDAAIKIPFETNIRSFLFAIDYHKKNLLEIFENSSVVYFYDGQNNETVEGRNTSSEQPLFWQRIHQLTPCNASLILDDCTNGTANCTTLDFNVKDSVGCEGGSMWLKSTNSTWQQLSTVSCHNESKEWTLANENSTTLPTPTEGIEIRCAIEKPEPWAVSASGLQVNPRVVKKKKGEEKETFSLMDSPYTWVGIGLLGIISMAAIVLISVYAFRKFGRNKKKNSKSKGSFKALPQETSATGESLSNSECEQRNEKADQTPVPTPTPSAATASKTPGPSQTPGPSASASRIDGPAAATVTKLSMIKTLEESKIAPIPGPPSN